jgi:hypothetical protein
VLFSFDGVAIGVHAGETPMQQLKMTRHAMQRLRQRGARPKEVAMVMTYGDIEVPAQNGSRFIRLSHHAVASLLNADGFTVQDVDRARRLTVLAGPADQVITVLKCNPDRRFLAARRGASRR